MHYALTEEGVACKLIKFVCLLEPVTRRLFSLEFELRVYLLLQGRPQREASFGTLLS